MGQHRHYIHSHRLAAEMWTTMKNNLLRKTFLSCSFYLYRFRKYVSYGFPIIIFCNPGVHYETPCISRSLMVYVCMMHCSAVDCKSMPNKRDNKQQTTTIQLTKKRPRTWTYLISYRCIVLDYYAGCEADRTSPSKHPAKSHLPSAGIIRSSPYSPR
jgi:hypothetical protein